MLLGAKRNGRAERAGGACEMVLFEGTRFGIVLEGHRRENHQFMAPLWFLFGVVLEGTTKGVKGCDWRSDWMAKGVFADVGNMAVETKFLPGLLQAHFFFSMIQPVMRGQQ